MMVRAILVLLILLNLGYFAWHMLQPEEAGREERVWRGRAPETIQLLAEGIKNGKAVKYGAAQAANTKLTLCTTIGVFPTREAAQVVRQRLMAVSIKSQLEMALPKMPDYLVYIPSLPSREQAYRLVDELEAKNIDGFVITEEGALKNAVSLGQFSIRTTAEAFQDARIKDGYNAWIQEKKGGQTMYVVALDALNSRLLSDALWQSFRTRYPFLKKSDKLCDESIASVTQLP